MGYDVVAGWSDRHPAAVDGADLEADGTLLSLHDGRCVRVAAQPDPSGSRRVRGVLRRVERIDLTIRDTAVTAMVTGIGHRRRCQLPVAVPTALSLALDGFPTSVTVLPASDRSHDAASSQDAAAAGVAR
jgi:hypothetical protein